MHVQRQIGVSERRACLVLSQPRSTQRYQGRRNDDESLVRSRIVAHASRYGRYGYRRITAVLWTEGLAINHKRVERIWREEGLKVPSRQPKRGRLWLNDGSCLRLRPEYPNHVWSYDFVTDCTSDGKGLRMLTLIDEKTRECLAIEVARRLKSGDVFEVLAEQFIRRGPPTCIRSDNGPEFRAHQLRSWLERTGVRTLFITPGSPWENGYIESFNGRFRDELLRGELFHTLAEARVLIEAWRRHYNEKRPHSALGYRPPAPLAMLPRDKHHSFLSMEVGKV